MDQIINIGGGLVLFTAVMAALYLGYCWAYDLPLNPNKLWHDEKVYRLREERKRQRDERPRSQRRR